VVDDLDVVPVGIEHERTVVTVVVLGALAGGSVVAVPRRGRIANRTRVGVSFVSRKPANGATTS
jgi:hypothetical protein